MSPGPRPVRGRPSPLLALSFPSVLHTAVGDLSNLHIHPGNRPRPRRPGSWPVPAGQHLGGAQWPPSPIPTSSQLFSNTDTHHTSMAWHVLFSLLRGHSPHLNSLPGKSLVIFQVSLQLQSSLEVSLPPRAAPGAPPSHIRLQCAPPLPKLHHPATDCLLTRLQAARDGDPTSASFYPWHLTECLQMADTGYLLSDGWVSG